MATTTRTAIPERTIKILFAKSQNQCAFPGCNHRLVDTVGEREIVLGEICHIEGVKKGAARYNPTRPKAALNDADNLVLMCQEHHKVIDEMPDVYDASRLREIKRQHEVNAIEITAFDARAAMLILNKTKIATSNRVYKNSTHIEAHDNATQNITINQTVKVQGRGKRPAVVPDEGTIGKDPEKRAYAEYLRTKLIDYLSKTPKYDGKRAGATVARKLKQKFGATCTQAPIEFFDAIVAFLQSEIDKTIPGRAQRKRGLLAYKTFDEFRLENHQL